MNWRHTLIAVALALAACGQPQPASAPDGAAPPAAEEAIDAEPELPQVDPSDLAAPNSTFTAIEPTELDVVGAATVMEALAPLLSPEMAEGASLHLTVRETGDSAVADIVRAGMADDSVSAGHVRIEFRHEADGWFPVNAYRRLKCARGGQAGQWTTELCP